MNKLKNKSGSKTPSSFKNLNVQHVPTGSLKLNPKNPRKNDAAVSKVAESLERFGFQQPLVVNADGVVIAGNTRLKAARKLGLPEVPVVYFQGSGVEATAYGIADNRTAEFSEWENQLLAETLVFLSEEDALGGVGFTDAEIDNLLASPVEDVSDSASSVPLPELRAPFPWFGGKRRIASVVWSRFGDVKNYVEPFFGSGAVLLGRPGPIGTETINDLDGFVCNFWRSIKLAPDETAKHATNPANENDLHARHAWLVARCENLRSSLEGNPDWHDPKIAGWWCWGICCWIGGGFCSGDGPWSVNEDGQLIHLGDAEQGVQRRLIHLGNAGRGVQRRRVHLGAGRGVQRRLVHLGNAGQGVQQQLVNLQDWFFALATRLKNVRVCSGDWPRAVTPAVTTTHGLTGVFLDPPYSLEANRDMNIYRKDSGDVAHAVREWALVNGEDPLLRIALCGYAGEHDMPASWDVYAWKTSGGMASGDSVGRENAKRERVWFSPHCGKVVEQKAKS